MAQTKTGRNVRWYFGGSAVGMGRMQHLKPDTSIKQDKVIEVGNPTPVEYVPGVPDTTVQLGYVAISKKQLAVALGQTIGQLGTGTGHVPEISTFQFDVVERRIVPGTEGTLNESYDGFTLYQLFSPEKHGYDQEVDKVISRSISGKCLTPMDFENINGIAFDKFNGTGSTTSFGLTHHSVGLATGYVMCRVEAPLGTVLKEGVDFTVASTSSTTTMTFVNAPAAGTNNILAIYPW